MKSFVAKCDRIEKLSRLVHAGCIINYASNAGLTGARVVRVQVKKGVCFRAKRADAMANDARCCCGMSECACVPSDAKGSARWAC